MKEKNTTVQFALRHTSGVPLQDDTLLRDLKRIARETHSPTVPARVYQQKGQYSHTTFLKRFRSWNEALRRAGLEISNEFKIPDEKLFENIEQLWVRLGRQPVKRDLVSPLLNYSERPYGRRFGGWRNALKSFINYVNSEKHLKAQSLAPSARKRKHRTPRDPNWRLRFLVMRRDNFKCRITGRSPATDPRVILEVDHIVPWDKGGETVMDNL